jgi:hypothetical protein
MDNEQLIDFLLKRMSELDKLEVNPDWKGTEIPLICAGKKSAYKDVLETLMPEYKSSE